MVMIRLSKTFRFEASHRLPSHPGKCRRLHGHSWELTVEVEGPIDPATGFVMDYTDIKKAVQPIVDDLDHKHLGTWAGFHLLGNVFTESHVPWLPTYFNATSENLLLAIADRLTYLEALNWSRLTLNETCTCSASLERNDVRS